MKRKSLFRRFWESLTGRGYIVLRMPLRSEMRCGHEAFVFRCADGDLSARFGRPDVYVAGFLQFLKNMGLEGEELELGLRHWISRREYRKKAV